MKKVLITLGLVIITILPINNVYAYYSFSIHEENTLKSLLINFSIDKQQSILIKSADFIQDKVILPILEKQDYEFLGYQVNDEVVKECLISDVNNKTISPVFEQRKYESIFYYNDEKVTSTYNEFGSKVTTPNIKASYFKFNDNFYYITYDALDSWHQTREGNRFNIVIMEYNCSATFGSGGLANSNYQLSYLKNAGYNFCSIDNNMVLCTNTASKVLDVYNNAWNILPISGNGYSKFKDMWCDSNYYNMNKR